jgi:hypothetical protein
MPAIDDLHGHRSFRFDVPAEILSEGSVTPLASRPPGEMSDHPGDPTRDWFA